MNYRVNDQEFARFGDAMRYASSIGAEVFLLGADPRRVWHPPKPVSAKRMRDYEMRKQARADYERLILKRG